MTYVSPYQGIQVDKTVENLYGTVLFSIKSTSDTGVPQTLVANTWKDVDFSNVEVEIGKDFDYTNGILTYIGTDDIILSLMTSSSHSCNIVNTKITLGQWKNAAVDYGAMNAVKLETLDAIEPIPIATPFRLSTGNTLNLRIMANNNCTVNMFHFQVLMHKIKIIQP